jgi:hypothetical protein
MATSGLYSMDKNGRRMVTWNAFAKLCYVRGLCGVNGIRVYTPVPTCTCALAMKPSTRGTGDKAASQNSKPVVTRGRI